MLGQAGQGLRVIGRERIHPGCHRTVFQGTLLVRHHQMRIKKYLMPQAIAHRAGAVRGVEAEQPGFDFLDGETADRAGEAGRKHRAHAVIGTLGIHDAVGESQGGLERIREPLFQAGFHHNAVHHRLNLMFQLFVQRRDLVDLIEFAIDFRPRVTFALQFGQLLFVFALAIADHRGEQQQLGALLHGHHAVNHLRHALRLNRQAGGRRIRHPGARP